MHTYARCALLAAALLLAACGVNQPGGEPGSSGLTLLPTTPALPTLAQPTPTAGPGASTSTALPTPQEPIPVAVEQLAITLEPFGDGLDQPVYLTHAGDGSGRLFVVEKRGRIVILRDSVPDAAPFLDIVDRVGSSSSEQGLLSVAFHPRFAENGRLFVNYTDRNGDTVVARFVASGDRADPASEVALLKIDQPYPNHNGGLIKFGPDGHLYIGMGDGGSAGDPHNNGQNNTALLGKLLRIDVDGGEPYAIPPDNPWASGAGMPPEVWALGLRNPWRFSFDRATGDLYVADVGQNAYEEINFQPAGAGAGANYGWNIMEASHCFRERGCAANGYVMPIAEYSHDQGCSVTGGYVYRGADFPALQGMYIFGDYCSGRVWGLRAGPGGVWEQTSLLSSNYRISSFGEDEAGELYVASLGDGTLYRVAVR